MQLKIYQSRRQVRVLAASHHLADRVNQLCGIVADAIFKHDFYILDILNFLRGIALDYDQVRLLARSNCTHSPVITQILRTVVGRNPDGFERSKSGFRQQLDLTLIAESRHYSSNT